MPPFSRSSLAAAALAVAFALGACGGGADNGGSSTGAAGDRSDVGAGKAATDASTTTTTPTDSGEASSAHGSSHGASAAPVEATAVDIVAYDFRPEHVRIRVGDELTWTNRDEFDHSVISADGTTIRSPEKMPTGASYSARFEKAGTFDYKCGIHNYMTGSVTVG